MAAAEDHSEMPFSPARLRDIKWVPPSIRTSFSGAFSRAQKGRASVQIREQVPYKY
jgi:hypothetical protein